MGSCGSPPTLPASTPTPDDACTEAMARPGADIPLQHAIDRLLDARLSLEEAEGLMITTALRRTEGNLSAAARLLKLGRGQLQYRVGKRTG
ncbi:MAG: hypothetical protein KA855_10935 [Zoogloea sp.]|nr:hypothetical protein [Zoogloea sp.]